MTFTRRQEPTTLTGAGFGVGDANGTGTGNRDGATNRTYTLTFPNPLDEFLLVIVAGQAMQPDVHYSITNSVLTIFGALDDSSAVTIQYFTSDGLPTTQTPRTEPSTLTGAFFTGSDGATNRTYNLTYTNAQDDYLLVIIGGNVLQPDVHFTLANDVITILTALDNTSAVTINYFTEETITTTYCDDSDVQRELLRRNSFDDTSTPTQSQVNQMILQAEDFIDQETQHAWREKTVTDEFYNIDPNINYATSTGMRIKLAHRKILPLDTLEGDKVEVWVGDSYEDYILTRTEGRNGDFWLDEVNGILWIRSWYLAAAKCTVKLTYRYGETTIPNDIKEAAALYVAIKILTNEDHGFVLNETGDNRNMAYDPRITRMQSRLNKILHNRTELRVFGPG